VQSLCSILSFLKSHEAEASGFSCVGILDDSAVTDRPILSEVVLEVLFSDPVGEIGDVEVADFLFLGLLRRLWL
jgi:hypothetical protein